jgi:hypothetical protein
MLVALCTCAPSATCGAMLPPLRGTVSGEAQVFGEGGPAVPWTITTATNDRGAIEATIIATPSDAEFRASAVLPVGDSAGAWRIERARMDLAAWWPRLAPHLAPAFASLSVTGRAAADGEGEWREGKPVGPLEIAAEVDTIVSVDPVIEAEGVQAEFELLSGWSGGELAGKGRASFARVVAAAITATNGSTAFARGSDGTAVVGPTRFRALGGEVEVAPFHWRDDPGGLELMVRVQRVELAELTAFLPEAVEEAKGRVSGRVLLRWTPEGGIVPLDGHLRVAEGESVELRLTPRPGFLTAQVPRRLQLLPGWFGAIGKRLFSPPNPAFQTLQTIELGEQPLVVETLLVTFFPPDHPLGRTAEVRIEGRPFGDSLVERVTIEVNLTGPLADLIRLGLDERVNIRGSLK